MKRIIVAFLAIALTLGLCACGGSKEYDSLQQSKIEKSEGLADNFVQVINSIALTASDSDYDDLPNLILNTLSSYAGLESVSNPIGQYNKEEIQIFTSLFQVDSDLGAFDGLLTSYAQMVEDMGGVPTVGPSKSKVEGKEIVVTYVMYGNNCDGEVVFTFSNDIFTRLKSGAASAHTSFSQKMSAAGRQMPNAGMNTLLGMGSVFIVLILISLIISSFTLLNRKGSNQETKPATAPAAPVAAPAEEEELVDDSELVAVITAAIAAYEGSAVSAGPDGFVVRSIRKANRRR